MANIFEYLNWRGDISFEEVGFNEVDGLLLSTFCYLSPSEKASEHLPVKIASLSKKDMLSKVSRNPLDFDLLSKMVESARFSDCTIIDYTEITDNDAETQFAAYFLRLCEGKYAVIFRGTDHSITGWKEDFNLSFLPVIPGQLRAKEYLNMIAELHPAFEGELYICGHSKGGNLAVYSAVTCDDFLQKKITGVFNYDGPGFRNEFIKQEGYLRIVDHIHTYLPDSSIVGLMFEQEEPFEIVESTNTGIRQHEPYSWEILGGNIVRCDCRSNSSFVMDDALKNWLEIMSVEERERFVTALFGLLEESGATSLEDLVNPKTILSAGKHFSNYSSEEKLLMNNAVKVFRQSLAGSMRKNKRRKVNLGDGVSGS